MKKKLDILWSETSNAFTEIDDQLLQRIFDAIKMSYSVLSLPVELQPYISSKLEMI